MLPRLPVSDKKMEYCTEPLGVGCLLGCHVGLCVGVMLLLLSL